jgi:hypothetical protein
MVAREDFLIVFVCNGLQNRSVAIINQRAACFEGRSPRDLQFLLAWQRQGSERAVTGTITGGWNDLVIVHRRRPSVGSPPETVRSEDLCPPPQRSQTRWRGMDGWRLNGFPHLLHFGFAHC